MRFLFQLMSVKTSLAIMVFKRTIKVLNVQYFSTGCFCTYRKKFVKQNESDLDYSGFYRGF